MTSAREAQKSSKEDNGVIGKTECISLLEGNILFYIKHLITTDNIIFLSPNHIDLT